MTNAEQTVGQIAAERPASVRIFQRHGIDFCCGGGIPIGQACAARGLDAKAVFDEIAQAESSTAGDLEQWQSKPLDELIDHIIARYHRPLDEELPRLEQLARKVARVHGDRHPELKPLLDAYLELKRDLDPHMMKEERVLFPMMRSGVGSGAANPIAVMRMEHEDVGALLTQIRELTGGFNVPQDACASFRALWQGLAELELSLHEHIHLENNILFPRALREG